MTDDERRRTITEVSYRSYAVQALRGSVTPVFAPIAVFE